MGFPSHDGSGWCWYMAAFTLGGDILMGSMEHHIYSSTMDPSWARKLIYIEMLGKCHIEL